MITNSLIRLCLGDFVLSTAALTRAHEAGAAAANCKALVIVAMMGAQRIHAEIGDWIAPHRVHMIGVACGVVVLDQQAFALNAIVVRLPRR